MILLSLLLLAAQAHAIPDGPARLCFEDARAICAADAGRLWGRPLCGPLLLVDPRTREIAANQADREGRLHPENGIFRGKLPEREGIANTAATWAGVKWTMLMWPLPEGPAERRQLLAHEMFHRIQPELGLKLTGSGNAHLDSLEGRFWLQLEWRALAAALSATGVERKRAIADALVFRSFRRSLFPNAADEENALEIAEGTAEYTGIRLGRSHPEAVAAAQLAAFEKQPTFIRSFA